MPYKYNDETTALKESNGNACFVDYSEKEIAAFRWVFPVITDSKNFIPLAKDPINVSVRKKCGGWALSFHETEEASVEAWEYLTEDKPNKFKKLGTHIAFGKVLKSDGKCSDSDEYLHFNFIEYKGKDLSKSFEIIRKLATDEMIKSL